MHLVRRFFKSLVARMPSTEDDAWVRSMLSDAEYGLWARFPRYDQRHTIEVARRVARDLGVEPGADSRWVAAALLHDIGKVDVRLGLVGRVVATVLRGVAGRERVAGWATRGGVRGEIGAYAAHAERGAEMIRRAGGREEVARWAEIHHAMEHRAEDPDGIVPVRAVTALLRADRD